MNKAVLAPICVVALVAIAALAFALFGLPRWCPEFCARHSPFVDQVIQVYLECGQVESPNPELSIVARKRLAEHFGPRAIPALMRTLTSPSTDDLGPYLTIKALADIGPAANAAIPVILAGLRAHTIPEDGFDSPYLADALSKMGLSPALGSALGDSDYSIRDLAFQVLRNSGRIEGFLMVWRALAEHRVVDPKSVLDQFDSFDYPAFKKQGEQLAELLTAVREVEAHGPGELVEWASWVLGEVEETE